MPELNTAPLETNVESADPPLCTNSKPPDSVVLLAWPPENPFSVAPARTVGLTVIPPEETFSTAPLSMTVLDAAPPETTFCRPPLSVAWRALPPNVPSTYWVPPDMIVALTADPNTSCRPPLLTVVAEALPGVPG